MKYLYLDAEMIPTQDEAIIELVQSKVKPPATHKKPETIQAWWENEGEAAKQKAYLDTALNGTYGNIVCLGWAFDDNPVHTLTFDNVHLGYEGITSLSQCAAMLS